MAVRAAPLQIPWFKSSAWRSALQASRSRSGRAGIDPLSIISPPAIWTKRRKGKARRRRCSSTTPRRNNAAIAAIGQIPKGCGHFARSRCWGSEPWQPPLSPSPRLALGQNGSQRGQEILWKGGQGRNWSSIPSVKEGHELVTSGSYQFVRHPIYTGILLAAFGSALVVGLSWFIVFAFVCFIFIARVNVEERLMMEQFPD